MHPGDLLGGRYRLGEPLGHGGMSVVWRAEDEVLGRAVAVKALTPALASNPDALARVRTEAKAAARLRHPAIVDVHDYGEVIKPDGRALPYVVMELVEGTPLAELVETGPLPWPVAVRVCADVAGALAAAHARGIVHRDVTPGNVMLTPGGAKLVDFGISAAVGEADSAPNGLVLGTPAYLAPERLDRGTVQPPTDVYALGLLLYKALTGRLPWQSRTTTQMLTAHRYVDPTPLPPVPGLPAQVAAVCDRCLAKRPEDRPASAALAGELAALAAWEPVALLAGPAVALLPAGGSLAGAESAGWFGRAPAATAAFSGVPRVPTAAMSLASPLPPSPRRRAVRLAAVGLLLIAAVTGALAGTQPDRPRVQAAATAAGLGSRPVECDVEFDVQRHAVGSFGAVITLTNGGTAAVDPWRLEFTFPGDQRVVGGANGTWQQSGQHVSVAGTGLPAGTTVTLPFDAAYQAGNPLPTEFRLNGWDCASMLTTTVDSPAPTVQTGGTGGGHGSGDDDDGGGKKRKGRG